VCNEIGYTAAYGQTVEKESGDFAVASQHLPWRLGEGQRSYVVDTREAGWRRGYSYYHIDFNLSFAKPLEC